MIQVKVNINDAAFARIKERVRERVQAAHPHKASVGVHEGEGSSIKKDYYGKDSDATVAEVANVNEFGAGQVPERSFLRSWFDQNVERLKKESADAMRSEYQGNPDAVRNQAAIWGQELKDWVASESFTPLSEMTKRERVKAGLSDGPPLIATGELVSMLRAMTDGSYL